MPQLYVERRDDVPDALRQIGISARQPVLVIVGGAGDLGDQDAARLEPVLVGLAELAARIGAVVIDGGTDSGVMRLIGRAHGEGDAFPLVGVAVAALAGAGGGRTPLEPHHSAVLLVPGREWGDESRWLSDVAGVVAGGAPSVTVLFNGGETAYQDASVSAAARRPVLVAEGSGRAADEIAAAARGEAVDERANALLETGVVRIVALEDSGTRFVEEVERVLTEESE